LVGYWLRETASERRFAAVVGVVHTLQLADTWPACGFTEWGSGCFAFQLIASRYTGILAAAVLSRFTSGGILTLLLSAIHSTAPMSGKIGGCLS